MNDKIGAVGAGVSIERAVPGWRLIRDDESGSADVLILAVDAIARRASSTLPIVAVIGDGAVHGPMIDSCAGWIMEGEAPVDWARVLNSAVAVQPRYQVRDLSDSTAAAIGALSADASRIAEALQSIAARETPAEPQVVTAATVRRLIRLRRDRDRFLPAMLFADPAWDMLLDLTAARLEGIDVPVSSLCIAAAVPTTTALRWIRTLTEAGLFERYEDPTDARRSHIRLTGAAADAMLAWLRLFIAQGAR